MLLVCGGFLLAVMTAAGPQVSGDQTLEQGSPEAKSKPASSKPVLTWRRSPTSIALLNHGRVVWRHVHDRKVGKPYMRVGLLDGTELTRPWPIPKGYPKDDHTWHRALWWSWKAIDGVNYWEKNQQGTDPVRVAVTTNADGSAKIHMTVAYHQPDRPPVVTEKRVIDVGAPDESGSYLIRWRATFTPAGDKAVVFNRNGYGGFAIRMAGEFCGDPKAGKPAWTFTRSEEQPGRKGSRWIAYCGTTVNGKAAGVAIFDHPDNPRHPALWATRGQYPYMNPSFTCRADYTLPAGESLTLTYGVLVHHGLADRAAIERAWKRFSAPAATPQPSRDAPAATALKGAVR